MDRHYLGAREVSSIDATTVYEWAVDLPAQLMDAAKAEVMEGDEYGHLRGGDISDAIQEAISDACFIRLDGDRLIVGLNRPGRKADEALYELLLACGYIEE